MTTKRFVVDTNVLISVLLFDQSVPGQAVKKALDSGVLLRSEPTLLELARVLERPKFDRYVTREERIVFLDRFVKETVPVDITRTVTASRDSQDNKFLELAVCGQATHVITGDADLLSLNPFQNVSIITPARFLSIAGSGAR